MERREFLRQAAAPLIVSGAPDLQVRGRARLKIVDVHTHCVVPEALALLNARVDRVELLTLEGRGLDARLATMDAQGIDLSVLCVNPNWYEADRALASTVVSLQNEHLARFCATHRDRFAA